MPTKNTEFEGPTQFCGNCGRAVSNRGRKAQSGVRYCMQPECRAAKARNERRRAEPKPPAQSECSGCGRPLPPRQQWAADSLGRWCKRPKCRVERVRTQDEGGVDKLPELMRRSETLKIALDFASEAVMCDSPEVATEARVTCPKCGLTSAIPRWVHPLLDMRPCDGTLEGHPVRNYGFTGVTVGWPFKREYTEVVS